MSKLSVSEGEEACGDDQFLSSQIIPLLRPDRLVTLRSLSLSATDEIEGYYSKRGVGREQEAAGRAPPELDDSHEGVADDEIWERAYHTFMLGEIDKYGPFAGSEVGTLRATAGGYSEEA
ncbi:hypothetical protein DL765_005544 [Monosporascus sp. GIB2]|nr:hypothetical protein DL765_005544 [Monosporascus sp. GIB2]